MAPPTLTDFGRKVLGHLPVYSADEAALIEAEGGPEVSIRSYPLAAFTARLAEDATTHLGDVPRTENEVAEALDALAGQKLAKAVRGEWRMTKLGFDALHAPVEVPDYPSGAVTVPLHPAVSKAGTS